LKALTGEPITNVVKQMGMGATQHHRFKLLKRKQFDADARLEWVVRFGNYVIHDSTPINQQLFSLSTIGKKVPASNFQFLSLGAGSFLPLEFARRK
jgi:hypothetical protein